MRPAEQHISYIGKLLEHAQVRNSICGKRGNMQPTVCLTLQDIDQANPIYIKRFCADHKAAEALAKTLRKGAVVTCYALPADVHISATVDCIEVQAPAQAAQAAPTNKPPATRAGQTQTPAQQWAASQAEASLPW